MENFNPDLSMSVEFSDSLNNNIVDSMAWYIGTLIAYNQQPVDSDSQNCIIQEFAINLLKENTNYIDWMSTDPEEIKTRYYAYNEKYKESLTVVN